MTLHRTERRRTRVAARRMAALGLVSGLSLAADRAAEAGIVYSGPQNIQVNSTNPSFALDLDGDSNADFTINWTDTGFQADEVSSTPGVSNAIVGSGGFATGLTSSDMIDSSSTFGVGAQVLGTTSGKDPVDHTGAFPGAGDLYLGLRFDIGGAAHFGWALVNDVMGDTGGLQSATIKGWAYESTARMGIRAGDQGGAVPEPASMLQLALGAAGVAGLTASRRRRSTTIEAN